VFQTTGAPAMLLVVNLQDLGGVRD
jgi:hypothetical protein